MREFFPESSITDLNIKPPVTHPNGSLWAAHLALSNEDSREAIEWLTQKEVNSNPVVLDTLAKAMMIDSQFTSAIKIWGKINYEDRLSAVASEAQAEGNLDLAYQAAQMAYELNPQAFTTHYANILRELNDEETAIDVLLNSIENYPEYASHSAWWKMLGDIYKNQGLWAQAEEAYQQALAEDPGNVNLWIELGWLAYERDLNPDQARSVFTKAIDIAPQKPAGYYAMGQLLEREGQLLDALEWYRQASEVEPDDLNNLLVYANALRDTDQFDLALVEYAKAIEQYPELWYSYYHLAWGYYMNKQYNNAIATIEKAMELNAGDLGIFIRAGLIYEASGLKEKALNAYQRVLELDAENGTALEAIQRLSQPDE